jgi:hypothetical protein
MISTTLTPDLLHGTHETEQTARGLRPHRLPEWLRERFPDPQLMMVESQPSGVRVVFRTRAREVELVLHSTRVTYRGVDRARGRVDLVVDGEVVGSDILTLGDRFETDLQTGATAFIAGEAHVARFADLPEGDKRVELWLPHNESVELVELRTDAAVEPAPEEGRVWLHHGSSISHGANAASPTQIWPAVAALRSGVRLHNLGLGGSALADPFVARVMRDTPADLISVKLGINIVNIDSMRLRSFVPAVHGFLDTIRDGHPDVPIVLVSPIFCGIHEQTPGPGAIDPVSFAGDQVKFTATGQSGDTAQGRLTLEVIRDAMESLVARRADDTALHYLDGTRLYGAPDAAIHPLPDNLHPDTDTHRLIGERFADYAFSAGGAFAGILG